MCIVFGSVRMIRFRLLFEAISDQLRRLSRGVDIPNNLLFDFDLQLSIGGLCPG